MTNAKVSIFSEKRTQLIVWILLLLMPLIGMAVDLIAPSLPAIASDLHVSTKTTKNVISVYLSGYALGNFFTGFLADALGRQKLIRMGLLGFVFVSLIPVFFPNITLLLWARFLQGITLGAVSVLIRAVCSDVLSQKKLAYLGTFFATMWGLGPIIGPVVGGYLQAYFGWQAGFIFFSGVSLILLIAIFIIVPETHFNRHPLNLHTMKTNLLEVLVHRQFLSLAMLMGLAYSSLIVFNTLGPFLIQTKFHYSPVFFGHLGLFLGVVFLMATFVCRSFLKYLDAERLFEAAIYTFFIIATLMLLASRFFSQSIYLVAIASALMFFATGFIFPLSMGKGLLLFRHIAGTATATMFLINILITSLLGFAVSFINVESAVPLMWVYFLLTLTSVLVYRGMYRN